MERQQLRELAQREMSIFPTYLNADDHTKEVMIGIFCIAYYKGCTAGIETGAEIWRPKESNK